MSLFYGLTGGIGSGKSTVAALFAQCGVPTLDLDAVGKAVADEAAVVQALVAVFGDSIIDEQQQLIRPQLAQLAFSSHEKTQMLNATMHPYILAREQAWRAKQTAPFCLIEASVLIESSAVERMDALIVVLADEALRKQRVLQRQQQTEALFAQIIQRQCQDKQRLALADYVLHNQTDKADLAVQVEQLFGQLSAQAGSRKHVAVRHG